MDVFEVARPRATCLLDFVEPAGDALLLQKHEEPNQKLHKAPPTNPAIF
jgi:hypothetical protein